ncbi:MAG: hypothetical protein RR873_01145 [Christensenella sp.]
MKNSAPNYWKLDEPSLLYVHYAFVDNSDHLADALFIKHRIKVTFQQECSKKNIPYVIVFCKVRKTDEAAFTEALSELNNKMYLLNHTDYSDACAQIAAMFAQ